MLSGTSITLETTPDQIENWIWQFYNENKGWIKNGKASQVSNDKIIIRLKVQKDDTQLGIIELYLYLNWPDRILVRGGYVGNYEAEFDTLWTEMLTRFGNGKDRVKSTPTEKVQKRAEMFREIKDVNPGLSYAAVALKANLKLPDEKVTEDDVRNAYRAMGWKWERADKIR